LIPLYISHTMELSEEDVEQMSRLFNMLGMDPKTDSRQDFKSWIMGMSKMESAVKTDTAVKTESTRDATHTSKTYHDQHSASIYK